MSDIETVRQWTRVVLTIVAILVTAFPLLYAVFSPWYKSHLGRAVLLQSLAVAFAVDFSAVFQYWAFTSNLYTLVVIRLLIFVFVGLAVSYLTIVLIFTNFIKHGKRDSHVEQPAGSAD